MSFLLLAAVTGFAAEETDPSILKNLDVFELELAADPQISPDGSQVAYVRKSNDIMTDKARSNIWTVAALGKLHRTIVESGAKTVLYMHPGGHALPDIKHPLTRMTLS